MNIGDPKHLEYLRNLPSSYILDLLADSEGLDEFSAQRVLIDRGYTPEEISGKIERRRHSRWPRRPELWRMARWLSLASTLVISIFNLRCLYRLLHTNDPFTVPLLFLLVLCAGFGFFLGFKLATHVYQGGRHQLYCGFPVPIGYVELETGKEQLPESSTMVLRMAVDALVGVNLTVFPMMLLYLGLH